MSEPDVYPVDDTNRCLGCELLLPIGTSWCDACIFATETVQESLEMYQQNGMSMMEALISTLRDAYDLRRIADIDASHPVQLSDWLPHTDGPEDRPF